MVVAIMGRPLPPLNIGLKFHIFKFKVYYNGLLIKAVQIDILLAQNCRILGRKMTGKCRYWYIHKFPKDLSLYDWTYVGFMRYPT